VGIRTPLNNNWLVVLQHDTHRLETATELSIAAITPLFVLIPLVGLAIFWIVQTLLKGIQSLTQRMASPDYNPTEALPDNKVVEEIRPFIQEINALMKRVNQLVSREKQFVSDAAHELKTPLAILKIHTDNLSNSNDANEQALSLRKLAQGIDRATHLTTQLLMLAKVEDKTDTILSVKEFSLISLCETIAGELYPLAEQRTQELALYATEEIKFKGDPELIQVMITNIINNALRYSPENGEISIRLSSSQNSIFIEVEDDGAGLTSEQGDLLKKRFARGNTDNNNGTGLGLAIVQRIADLHFASVEFIAKSDSQKATCRIKFSVL